MLFCLTIGEAGLQLQWRHRNVMTSRIIGISYHLTWLFVQQLIQADNKEKIRAMHNWPFVRGIHWCSVPYLSYKQRKDQSYA